MAGSDFSDLAIVPGVDLHNELALFVEARFTPLEALQTATIEPAKFLGRLTMQGTIEKGKVADLVLLDADPLGKKTTSNLTMIVDSIDADGSAHVKAKYTQSMEGISGVAASVLAGEKEFQGTLTADGRVLPTFDANAATITDSHGRLTNANAANTNAQVMQGTFGDFNTFITGAAKRPKFKTGDVWHLSVQDAMGITRQYDFSVMELDSSNASAAVISMKSDISSQSSSQKINASGHYDSARRILTSYHEENVYGSSSPNGITSSGVMMEDINLRK